MIVNRSYGELKGLNEMMSRHNLTMLQLSNEMGWVFAWTYHKSMASVAISSKQEDMSLLGLLAMDKARRATARQEKKTKEKSEGGQCSFCDQKGHKTHKCPDRLEWIKFKKAQKAEAAAAASAAAAAAAKGGVKTPRESP